MTDAVRGAATTRATSTVIALCALAAAGLDALQLTRPGYLLGGTPDIGVLFGAAVRLVHGVLPYRDFVIVQPPGIALLLSPAGLLSYLTGTRWALEAVRLATVLLAAGSAVLAARLVRHRGPLPALVAGGVMAAYPAELYALNAGLLEPLVNLFCLLAAASVFEAGEGARSPRRWLLGGLAIGFAVAVKLPALVPALVLAAMCLPDPRRRLLPLLAGGVAGFAVPCAAFFAAAPGSFVRDVLISQLGRLPSGGRAPLGERLQGMTGTSTDATALAVACVLLAVIVAGMAVPGRRRSALEWFAAATLLLVAIVQFVPSQYYPQYAAQLAPFLAIVLAVAVDRLAALVRRPAAALAVAGVILLVLLGARAATVQGSSTPDPAPAVDAVVPSGACTLSNGPRVLVPSDRLVSSVPGCTEMLDPFGTMLAYSDDPGTGVELFRQALDHTDYLVLGVSVQSWLTGTYAPLQAYVASDFQLLRSGGIWIYVRDGYPVA
jgi:hypothetical protein